MVANMSSTTPPVDFGLFTSLRYDQQLLFSEENTKLSGNEEASPFYNLRFHYDRLVDALHAFGWRLIPSKVNPEDEFNPKLEDTKVERGEHPQAFEPIRDLERFRKGLVDAVDNYFRTNPQTSRESPLKLRARLYRTGEFIVDVTQTTPVPLTNLFPPNPLPSPSSLLDSTRSTSSLPSTSNPTPTFSLNDDTLLIDTCPMTPSHYTRFKTWPRPHYEAARTRLGLSETDAKREVLLWNHDRWTMEGSRTNVYFWRPIEPSGADLQRETGFGWITPSEGTSGCLSGTERRWMIEYGMITIQDLKIDDLKDGEIALLSNGLRGTWPVTVQKY
ncbi:hypothetical protein FRC19_007546 [Serendipita sp. 401]|nr:hypothetical protein FRC19_007546 [Serendipita sp. 401]KAG9030577.1 hypothetical protein FS842_004365 [Serendipita sp. 407]